MSRRVSEALQPELSTQGEPVALWYRDVRYQIEVIGMWRLSDRWWDREGYSDRIYYRVMSRDLQIFVLYANVALDPPLWILDLVVD